MIETFKKFIRFLMIVVKLYTAKAPASVKGIFLGIMFVDVCYSPLTHKEFTKLYKRKFEILKKKKYIEMTDN